MPIRSIFAFDSDSLVVTSSSNGSIVGNPIINNSNTPDGTTFAYTGGSGATVSLDDTFRPDRFDDGREGDHIITDGGGLVANGTEVEAESRIVLRELDANGVQVGPRIVLTVFSQGGVTSDVWGFSSSNVLTPGANYVKIGGNNTGTTAYNTFIACFGPDTPILTPSGEVPIETLDVGSCVWTSEDTATPIRWIASTEVAGTGRFAPIVFAPNALGNTRELVVSPEHRMLVQGRAADLLFGEPAVFVAAKFLRGLPGVTARPCARIRYTHFMCDRHMIVRAAGALSESFFYSDTALSGLEDAARCELRALFPALADDSAQFGNTAARTLRAHEAAVLCAYL